MSDLTDRKLKRSDFVSLENEDFNQRVKWGVQTHSTWEWFAYTAEELGELSQAICEYEYRGGNPSHIYREAVQVATLAIKIAIMADEQLEK